MRSPALGDADGAFETLERACEQRNPNLLLLPACDAFKPLHEDPRFADLANTAKSSAERTPMRAPRKSSCFVRA